jgi:hypothetical protein
MEIQVSEGFQKVELALKKQVEDELSGYMERFESMLKKRLEEACSSSKILNELELSVNACRKEQSRQAATLATLKKRAVEDENDESLAKFESLLQRRLEEHGACNLESLKSAELEINSCRSELEQVARDCALLVARLDGVEGETSNLVALKERDGNTFELLLKRRLDEEQALNLEYLRSLEVSLTSCRMEQSRAADDYELLVARLDDVEHESFTYKASISALKQQVQYLEDEKAVSFDMLECDTRLEESPYVGVGSLQKAAEALNSFPDTQSRDVDEGVDFAKRLDVLERETFNNLKKSEAKIAALKKLIKDERVDNKEQLELMLNGRFEEECTRNQESLKSVETSLNSCFTEHRDALLASFRTLQKTIEDENAANIHKLEPKIAISNERCEDSMYKNGTRNELFKFTERLDVLERETEFVKGIGGALMACKEEQSRISEECASIVARLKDVECDVSRQSNASVMKKYNGDEKAAKSSKLETHSSSEEQPRTESDSLQKREPPKEEQSRQADGIIELSRRLDVLEAFRRVEQSRVADIADEYGSLVARLDDAQRESSEERAALMASFSALQKQVEDDKAVIDELGLLERKTSTILNASAADFNELKKRVEDDRVSNTETLEYILNLHTEEQARCRDYVKSIEASLDSVAEERALLVGRLDDVEREASTKANALVADECAILAARLDDVERERSSKEAATLDAVHKQVADGCAELAARMDDLERERSSVRLTLDAVHKQVADECAVVAARLDGLERERSSKEVATLDAVHKQVADECALLAARLDDVERERSSKEVATSDAVHKQVADGCAVVAARLDDLERLKSSIEVATLKAFDAVYKQVADECGVLAARLDALERERSSKEVGKDVATLDAVYKQVDDDRYCDVESVKKMELAFNSCKKEQSRVAEECSTLTSRLEVVERESVKLLNATLVSMAASNKAALAICSDKDESSGAWSGCIPMIAKHIHRLSQTESMPKIAEGQSYNPESLNKIEIALASCRDEQSRCADECVALGIRLDSAEREMLKKNRCQSHDQESPRKELPLFSCRETQSRYADECTALAKRLDSLEQEMLRQDQGQSHNPETLNRIELEITSCRKDQSHYADECIALTKRLDSLEQEVPRKDQGQVHNPEILNRIEHALTSCGDEHPRYADECMALAKRLDSLEQDMLTKDQGQGRDTDTLNKIELEITSYRVAQCRYADECSALARRLDCVEQYADECSALARRIDCVEQQIPNKDQGQSHDPEILNDKELDSTSCMDEQAHQADECIALAKRLESVERESSNSSSALNAWVTSLHDLNKEIEAERARNLKMFEFLLEKRFEDTHAHQVDQEGLLSRIKELSSRQEAIASDASQQIAITQALYTRMEAMGIDVGNFTPHDHTANPSYDVANPSKALDQHKSESSSQTSERTTNTEYMSELGQAPPALEHTPAISLNSARSLPRLLSAPPVARRSSSASVLASPRPSVNASSRLSVKTVLRPATPRTNRQLGAYVSPRVSSYPFSLDITIPKVRGCG